MMYERETKYRPLIAMDTDGTEYFPMFMALKEETVKAHHRLYLKESIHHAYRLCSTKIMTAADCSALRIHCPYCNTVMEPVTEQRSGLYHALYVCDRCP